MTTVAAVIIGNEVLSAKVTDANGALLITRLRERGARLVSMQFVPDEIDAIVEAVTLARRRATYVITSGGVGPTHDDVTVRAVALALGVQVVQLPEMVALIRAAHGSDPVAPEALRMADAPAGSVLLPTEEHRFPVLACGDLFLLPGVPQLFRVHLETVLKRLPSTPVVLRSMFLNAHESDIAAALDAAALAMPDVAFGSYPTWDRAAGYRVKLTIEHRDGARVEAACAKLRETLPAGALVRED